MLLRYLRNNPLLQAFSRVATAFSEIAIRAAVDTVAYVDGNSESVQTHESIR